MRSLNGMHWPNYRMWDLEQCLRIVGLDGTVTVLHQQLVNDSYLGGQTADDENNNVFGKLRFGYPPQGMVPAPNRFIHIRCYHPDWTKLDPVKWAEHTVDMLSHWKGSRDQANLSANLWDDPYVGVSPANEQDIEPSWNPSMQTIGWYQKIAAWNLAWVKRVNELVPNRKALLVSPAFAGGHEPVGGVPDSEYQIPAVRDMLLAFDVVGIHAYALMHERQDSAPGQSAAYWYMLRPFRAKGYKDASDVGGVVRQYPNLTYLVSECGTFTHSDKSKTDATWAALDAFYRECQKYRVVGVTPFIWNSTDSHPQNMIWPNNLLRAKLEQAPRYPALIDVPARGFQPVPTPVPDNPWPTHDEWAKIVYFLEQAQRDAEAAGLLRVSHFIGSRYTSKAIEARDVGNG